MNLEILENVAIYCPTKEQCAEVIKILNRIDDREWMKSERNEHLNSGVDHSKYPYYGIYRDRYMGLSEALTFGYSVVESYEWFMNNLNKKQK